jgi:hypothetical protein
VDTPRLTAEEVKRRMDGGEPVTFLDARADDAWQGGHADTRIDAGASGFSRGAPVRDPPRAIDRYVLHVTTGEVRRPGGAHASRSWLAGGQATARRIRGLAPGGYPVEPKPGLARTVEDVAENLRQAEGDDDIPV